MKDGTKTKDLLIAGRKFQVIKNSNLRHDLWMHAQIRRSRVGSLNVKAGETAEEFARRVLGEFSLNGDVFVLLGGCLMPAEIDCKDWTPAIGEATGQVLANVTDPADKEVVRSLIASAMAGLFATGLSSLLMS